MEEIFGLPLINNPIPSAETNNSSGFNNVATVNDLSDLFLPGVIPTAPNLLVSVGALLTEGDSSHVVQQVQITNNGKTPVFAPLSLALDHLNSDVTLVNANGNTAVLAPLGSPYINVPVGSDGALRPSETKTVKLSFLNPNNSAIAYSPRLLNVTPAP